MEIVSREGETGRDWVFPAIFFFFIMAVASHSQLIDPTTPPAPPFLSLTPLQHFHPSLSHTHTNTERPPPPPTPPALAPCLPRDSYVEQCGEVGKQEAR